VIGLINHVIIIDKTIFIHNYIKNIKLLIVLDNLQTKTIS
jgi:hypothetical protein